MEYELEEREFIELNKLLKFMGLVETGGEAKIRIGDGLVYVNHEQDIRVRRKLYAGDIVAYSGEIIAVK